MKAFICKVCNLSSTIADKLAPVANLFVRGLLLDVFFRAGLLKIQAWDTTVMLFTPEGSSTWWRAERIGSTR